LHCLGLLEIDRGGVEKHFVDGVVFHGGAEAAGDIEYAAGKDFVPLEIAFDKNGLGAKGQGVPDGHAGGHAASFEFVAFCDHASALVAQDAHGPAA